MPSMMMRRLAFGPVVAGDVCNFRLVGAPGWGQWFPPNMHQRGEGARNQGGVVACGGWWGGGEGGADGRAAEKLSFDAANRRLSALRGGHGRTESIRWPYASSIRQLFCVGQNSNESLYTSCGRRARYRMVYKGLLATVRVARAAQGTGGRGPRNAGEGRGAGVVQGTATRTGTDGGGLRLKVEG